MIKIGLDDDFGLNHQMKLEIKSYIIKMTSIITIMIFVTRWIKIFI